MEESTLWWLVAGGAVIAELLTGTFYLLMLALGMVAGAAAAHMGASTSAQLLAAALVGSAAVVACHLVRRRHPAGQPATRNGDVNQDVGATVQVDAWNADGTAQVRYRGAQWTVVLGPGAAPAPGLHRVVEVIGSRLMVDPA
ncbi:NfeD family protein [Paracidovorax wautersii]|uniref:NfeD family protein n=1 Tax=Paracidovorax wautersii TaxID=1177982 RepID=UPI0031D87EB3